MSGSALLLDALMRCIEIDRLSLNPISFTSFPLCLLQSLEERESGRRLSPCRHSLSKSQLANSVVKHGRSMRVGD